ncbi:MAG: hypothetical protein ACOC3V_05315 [bacterium]
MKFIRFGGLSPVKQDQYDTSSDKTFHNPPRRKGNYAFPYPYIEYFLLGSSSDPGHISNKSMWLKDEEGNLIKEEDFFKYDRITFEQSVNEKYIKLLKKLKIKKKDLRSSKKGDTFYVTILKKPKYFEYNGEIWHHLGNHLKPHQILETSGSWVKTDMDDYLIALKLEIKESRKGMLKFVKEYSDINNYLNKDPFKHHYSRDHLEVFIEKI